MNEQRNDELKVPVELLREARDNCEASIAETGISDVRRAYRRELRDRLSAALAAAPAQTEQQVQDLAMAMAQEQARAQKMTGQTTASNIGIGNGGIGSTAVQGVYNQNLNQLTWPVPPPSTEINLSVRFAENGYVVTITDYPASVGAVSTTKVYVCADIDAVRDVVARVIGQRHMIGK